MNKLMVVLASSLLGAGLIAGGACGAPQTKPATQAQAVSAPMDPAGKAKSPRAPRTARSKAAFPSTVYSPAQAIAEAAKDERGAKGVFEFKVASVGGNGGKGRSIYLNSEADYHDAKNISVMVRPAAVQEMEQSLGGPLDKTLAGKRVAVTGTAKPVKTNIYDADHKKTGQTFMQTRIIVAKADKLVVK